MDASPRAISPLRQRMIDDMRMCKLSPKTQLQYIRAVQQVDRLCWPLARHRHGARTCGVTNCTWSITVRRRSRSMRRSPG